VIAATKEKLALYSDDLLILAFAAILVAVGWPIYKGFRANVHTNVTYNNGAAVPAKSRDKAKGLGYYCPSWDATNAGVSPQHCYMLDKK
jgi:hypothetical protein